MASRILLLGGSAGYLLKFRDRQIRELVSRGWHVAAAAPDMDSIAAKPIICGSPWRWGDRFAESRLDVPAVASDIMSVVE